MKIKDARLNLRLAKEEKFKIQVKANTLKLSLSDFVVDASLNRVIKVQAAPDQHTLKLKMEISKIGSNLWTLMRLRRKLDVSEEFKFNHYMLDLKKTLNQIDHYYDSQNNKLEE